MSTSTEIDRVIKGFYCTSYYNWLRLKRGPAYHNIKRIIREIEADYQSEAELTNKHPYLALSVSYWVSFVNILEKIDRVITAPHCILWEFHLPAACIITQPVIHTKPTEVNPIVASRLVNGTTTRQPLSVTSAT